MGQSLFQSGAKVISKCGSCFKVGQVFHSEALVLFPLELWICMHFSNSLAFAIKLFKQSVEQEILRNSPFMAE